MNARAQWSERSPNEKGIIDVYFKPPNELSGGARTLYNVLTVLSLPILIPSMMWVGMLKLRYWRMQINGFIAFFGHGLSTFVVLGVWAMLGDALGVPPYWVAIPMTVLTWLPLLARYALPKLANG